MNVNELKDQIAIEFESIERTLGEVRSLCRDLAHRDPVPREVAAGGLFLANFYNGVENVLKRVWLFHGLPLPSGEAWHVELFKGFCHPVRGALPCLLDPALEADLAPFRRFRHVVFHAYGVRLRWDHMRPGLEAAGGIFHRFKARVEGYLQTLETGADDG